MNPLAALCTVLGFIGLLLGVDFAVWLMLYGIVTSTSPS